MMYYVTHTDEHGEHHQLGYSFEADSPEAALALILAQAGAEDDGNYAVYEDFEVTYRNIHRSNRVL